MADLFYTSSLLVEYLISCQDRMPGSLIITCTCKAFNFWPAGLSGIRETVVGAFSPLLCELFRKKQNKTKPKPKTKPKTKKPTCYLSAFRSFLSCKDFKNTQKIHNRVKEYFPNMMEENCHGEPQWQFLLGEKLYNIDHSSTKWIWNFHWT